ncbi:hypothetical protein [Methylibium sp.]|uniref:hypothetical protein n=1 Tax=Methylibium sp. TaxID=2067992 RepID=UPI003D1284A2
MAFFRPKHRSTPAPVPVQEAEHAAIDPRDGGTEAAQASNWLASSFDLRQGLEVSESPLDALSGDLLAELQEAAHLRSGHRRPG